jgi:hypothetical protein
MHPVSHAVELSAKARQGLGCRAVAPRAALVPVEANIPDVLYPGLRWDDGAPANREAASIWVCIAISGRRCRWRRTRRTRRRADYARWRRRYGENGAVGEAARRTREVFTTHSVHVQAAVDDGQEDAWQGAGGHHCVRDHGVNQARQAPEDLHTGMESTVLTSGRRGRSRKVTSPTRLGPGSNGSPVGAGACSRRNDVGCGRPGRCQIGAARARASVCRRHAGGAAPISDPMTPPPGWARARAPRARAARRCGRAPWGRRRWGPG